MNIGKRGVSSFSLGRRGMHYTVGRTHTRATIGLPGSGIFVTGTEPRRMGDHVDRAVSFLLVIFAMLALGIVVLAVLGGCSAQIGQPIPPGAVASLTPGASTMADAAALMGPDDSDRFR